MDSASLYGVSCESNEDRDEMIFNLDFGMLDFLLRKICLEGFIEVYDRFFIIIANN